MNKYKMGIGDWGLGIGGLGVVGWGFWVLATTPNPQSPIPNPQSPFHYRKEVKL